MAQPYSCTALSPMEHYGSLDDLSAIPLRKIEQTLYWLIYPRFFGAVDSVFKSVTDIN